MWLIHRPDNGLRSWLDAPFEDHDRILEVARMAHGESAVLHWVEDHTDTGPVAPVPPAPPRPLQPAPEPPARLTPAAPPARPRWWQRGR